MVATRMPTTTGLTRLLEELRELPGWPDVEVGAGLLVAETLRALGWPAPTIAALVGVDLTAREGATCEVTR